MMDQEKNNEPNDMQQIKTSKSSETVDIGKSVVSEPGCPDDLMLSNKSSEDALTIQKHLESIEQKIDAFLDKLEAARIKDEQDNKLKFKRLLEGISQHLNVNFNKSVEVAVRNEVKNLNQQSKSFIENCINVVDKKYNESFIKLQKAVFDMSNKGQGKPESDEYLDVFKRVLVNNVIPVIESCFEEIRLQVLESLKTLEISSVKKTQTPTITIEDELNSFMKEGKINEAAMLAMDCDDEIFIRYILLINSTHIDNFDAFLLSRLLIRAIQYCKDHEKNIKNILDCIEALLEGFDLHSVDTDEVKELYKHFTDLETLVQDRDKLTMIVKFQKRRCETRLNRKVLN